MDNNQNEIKGFLILKDEDLLEIEGGNSLSKYLNEFIEKNDPGKVQSGNNRPIKSE